MPDQALYRCPSCEYFFRIDDWSMENDLCVPCFTEMEKPNGTTI